MFSFDELKNIISEHRINTYLSLAKNNEIQAVDLYMQNLKISKNLYVNLHWLEISLRNKINDELCKKYGENWYDCDYFMDIEKVKIKECKQKLTKNKYKINNQNMVANLSFGFWVNIFHSKYENLWRSCTRPVFKKNEVVVRKDIYDKLNLLLKVRNRFSHHECIINYHHQFSKDLEFILNLINPNLIQLLI